MDPLDKAILASLYISTLEPQVSSYDRIKDRLPIGKELYRSKVEQLSERGFIEKNDNSKLSFIGRDVLKVVLVGGVFDLIHPGHIHTLKAAKGACIIFKFSRSCCYRKGGNTLRYRRICQAQYYCTRL